MSSSTRWGRTSASDNSANRREGRRAPSELARRLDDPHEVRVLLEEATGLDAVRLLVTAEDEVAPDRVEAALAAAERRRVGEPLQHVVGRWPFRSVELAVDGRALIPRPETELVVEVALAELDRIVGGADRLSQCLDLGTGTGAIALSIAIERPASEVVAVDASAPALELARANLAGQRAEVQRRVRLVEGSWYEPLDAIDDGAFDLIVSNPPYLSTEEWEGRRAARPRLRPARRARLGAVRHRSD